MKYATASKPVIATVAPKPGVLVAVGVGVACVIVGVTCVIVGVGVAVAVLLAVFVGVIVDVALVTVAVGDPPAGGGGTLVQVTVGTGVAAPTCTVVEFMIIVVKFPMSGANTVTVAIPEVFEDNKTTAPAASPIRPVDTLMLLPRLLSRLYSAIIPRDVVTTNLVLLAGVSAIPWKSTISGYTTNIVIFDFDMPSGCIFEGSVVIVIGLLSICGVCADADVIASSKIAVMINVFFILSSINLF